MTAMLVSAAFGERLRDRIRAGAVAYTPESRLAFSNQLSAAAHVENVMTVSGDVAEISISGVLVNSPDILLWMLGYDMTSYPDIQAALAAAEVNPAVKRLVLAIDSPGGEVAGLFETIQALNAFSNPRTDFALWLTQRMGGPMPGEDDLDFANRIAPLMATCREMRARGAPLAEYEAPCRGRSRGSRA